MKKLELKNLKVKKISQKGQTSIKGGTQEFLSIGWSCSARNMCFRTYTRAWGDCDCE